MPETPAMPAIRQYLPDVALYLPDIPMPEPVSDLKSQMIKYDTEVVCPLIRKVNHVILAFSLFATILGCIDEGIAAILVFKPSMIISVAKKEGDDNSGFSLPYIWTLVTSCFVETNIVFLVINLILINYIVQTNRRSFESQWKKSDYIKMLCVSGFLANSNVLLFELIVYGVSKNVDSYNAYSRCSLNLVILSLLLGLR